MHAAHFATAKREGSTGKRYSTAPDSEDLCSTPPCTLSLPLRRRKTISPLNQDHMVRQGPLTWISSPFQTDLVKQVSTTTTPINKERPGTCLSNQIGTGLTKTVVSRSPRKISLFSRSLLLLIAVQLLAGFPMVGLAYRSPLDRTMFPAVTHQE